MVQFPVGGSEFSLLQSVQISCGAHIFCSSMNTKPLSPRLKRQRHEAKHRPRSSTEVQNKWFHTFTSQYSYFEWWLGRKVVLICLKHPVPNVISWAILSQYNNKSMCLPFSSFRLHLGLCRLRYRKSSYVSGGFKNFRTIGYEIIIKNER